jgi:hypothetical protein
MNELPRAITAPTAKHAAAFFHANLLDVMRKGSAESIKAQGTMTFLNYRGKCLGVTNQHVIGEYTWPAIEKVFHLALSKHTPLSGRLLFSSTQENHDYPYDVAVFLIPEEVVISGGKIPINLESEYQELCADQMALAVGFPGIERKKKNDLQMEHPLYHVTATCRLASDRKLILQDEATPRKSMTRFGGMSGGPIFRLVDGGGYRFSGILFEGRGFSDTDESRDSSEIWVYGFPFGPHQVDRGLELFGGSI